MHEFLRSILTTYERTYLQSLFQYRIKSEKVLRGKLDETFLVRATDLCGPAHVFNVDIVWVTEIHVDNRTTKHQNNSQH